MVRTLKRFREADGTRNDLLVQKMERNNSTKLFIQSAPEQGSVSDPARQIGGLLK